MTSILVLDESLPELQSLSDILEQAGYDLVLTMEPQRALKLCEEIRFDAVLCNLYLHEPRELSRDASLIAGLDAIAKLTTMEPGQRVIVMAPDNEEQGKDALNTLGASGVVSKECAEAELLEAIKVILNQPRKPMKTLPRSAHA